MTIQAKIHDLPSTLINADPEFWGGDIMLSVDISREMDIEQVCCNAREELRYWGEDNEDLTSEFEEEWGNSIAALFENELDGLQLAFTGSKEYTVYIGLSS